MTVTELMQDHAPSSSFEGFTTADDNVLAIDFDGNAATPGAYIVAQTGIKGHPGKLAPKTQSTQYVRAGEVVTKTGTSRTFTISGDRYIGDPFQDKLLALKYKRGQDVIKKYVHFNMLTGKGEIGEVSIVIEDDGGGEAGNTSSISATLTSTKEPDDTYVYAPGV